MDLGCPGPSHGGEFLCEYIILVDRFIGHSEVRPRRFQAFAGLISTSHWRKDYKMGTGLSVVRGLTWSSLNIILF